MYKKIIAILMVMGLMLSNLTSFAQDNETQDTFGVEDFKKISGIDFETMSVEELNTLIDRIANGKYKEIRTGYLTTTQLAWLAAAEIARENGYECAALIVEYSVANRHYEETYFSEATPIWDVLGNLEVYQNQVTMAYNSGLEDYNGGFTISKSDNVDLFYALHNVDINVNNPSPGTIFSVRYITVTDTFDFDLDNDYDDLFTTLVNNWAWLCQQTGDLYPIQITLSTIYT